MFLFQLDSHLESQVAVENSINIPQLTLGLYNKFNQMLNAISFMLHKITESIERLHSLSIKCISHFHFYSIITAMSSPLQMHVMRLFSRWMKFRSSVPKKLGWNTSKNTDFLFQIFGLFWKLHCIQPMYVSISPNMFDTYEFFFRVCKSERGIQKKINNGKNWINRQNVKATSSNLIVKRVKRISSNRAFCKIIITKNEEHFPGFPTTFFIWWLHSHFVYIVRDYEA